MKLDLCIHETLSYMHVTMETTFVAVKELRIYHKNAEQKTTVVHFQTCYKVQLKALYVEVSGRTSSLLRYSCMIPKIINIGQQ